MSEYFFRRLPTADADALLDELFLASGVKAEPFAGARMIFDPEGHPKLICRPISSAESLIQLSRKHYPEVINVQQ